MAINLRTIEDPEANALAAAGRHTESGIEIVPHGYEGPTPPLTTKGTNVFNQIAEALLPHMGGGVYAKSAPSSGFIVSVKGLRFKIGATTHILPDNDSFTCTASVVNHVYTDSSLTVKKNSGSWPAGDIFRLALVTCDATGITSVASAIKENFAIGAGTAWSTIAAAQLVDMANFGLDNLGELIPTASTELTISAGSITPTKMIHSVDTEADAATDNLDTITANASKVGQILILSQNNSSRDVTIRNLAGNIDLRHTGDFTFTDNITHIVMIQYTATLWTNLTRLDGTLPILTADLDVGNFRVGRVRGFQLTAEAKTIAAGIITNTTRATHILADTEAAAATDDLDQLQNGVSGDLAFITAANSAHTVVVKHAIGANRFRLTNAKDVTLDDINSKGVALRHDGTQWTETFRWPLVASDLAGSDEAVPMPIKFHLPGTLTNGVKVDNFIAPFAGTIESVTGHVNTAPTATACIVDVLVNGLSIFASQAEMVNIAAAANQDTSAVKDHAVAAGDRISYEVEQHSNAADLTLALKFFAKLQTPPT